MSTTYTPTSNWTNRDLKGRDLQAKPLRPSEPVSFSSDPATERLSRRMAEDVRPERESRAVAATPDDDDFMNRPMVNASDKDAASAGPDIFDAPMFNEASATASTDDSVFEAPMADHRAMQSDRRAPVVAASAAPSVTGAPAIDARDDVITPSYGAAPRRRGLSPVMMVGVPLGVVAVAAVGWLALSGGEATVPAAEPTQPLEIAEATPAADALINMPVSETGAAVETASLAPAAAVIEAPARPARATPARTEPVRAEPAPVESAPAAAIVAPAQPETPAISPEAAPAPETAIETPAPLIATEPLAPQ